MSRAVAAARAALGTRFRLHGRGSDGLDCVGLAALALRAEGYAGPVPSGYALRSGDGVAARRTIAALGLAEAGDTRPGDLLLFASGPGQLHLGIATEGGLIHADASLRRVVERPGPLLWPVLGRWRLAREGD